MKTLYTKCLLPLFLIIFSLPTFAEDGDYVTLASLTNTVEGATQNGWTIQGEIGKYTSPPSLGIKKDCVITSPAIDFSLYSCVEIVADLKTFQNATLVVKDDRDNELARQGNLDMNNFKPFTLKISDTDSPISYKTQLKLECIINSGNNSDRVTVKDLIIRGIKTRESVAIGSTGLASFCPLLDVNIPEGLTAYYLTSDGITETTINLTKYSGTSLKAGEGVIVSGTSNTSYQLEKTTGEVQAIEGNQLKGCTENTTLTEGEAYLLAKNSDGTAAVFKKCAAGTLAQGKAYLPATSASKLNQAQEIRVDMGGTTAITSANISSDQDTEAGASYSLTGQRVSQQYKGIVIRNGKKFLK